MLLLKLLLIFMVMLSRGCKEFPSVRIEHATLLDPRLIEKMNSKKMKFGVVSNIDFFYAEWDSYSVNLLPQQYARTYMKVKEIYHGVQAP